MREIFLWLPLFPPLQIDKNTCDNSQQKFSPKMLRMSKFISEIFFGPIQNGQNTFKNFQTKFLLKMLRMSKFTGGFFWG